MLLNKLDIYSWIIIVLTIFVAAGAYSFGPMQTLPQVAVAVVAANAFDILAKYVKTREFRFTKSATVTGLFIGMLLPLPSVLYLPALLSAIAIASKHLVNWKGRHIFNPTLFSFAVAAFTLKVFPAWWGSFAFPPQLPMLNLVVLIVLGAIITIRQRRYDLVLPFLAVYLATNAGIMLAESSQISYNSLIDSTTLFALVFMLVEPKTSPLFRRARIFYGVAAAIIFIALNFFAVENVPLFAILIANLFVLPLDKYFR